MGTDRKIILKDIQILTEVLIKLEKDWENAPEEVDQELADRYPFEKNLGEVISDVTEWRESFKDKGRS